MMEQVQVQTIAEAMAIPSLNEEEERTLACINLFTYAMAESADSINGKFWKVINLVRRITHNHSELTCEQLEIISDVLGEKDERMLHNLHGWLGL